MIKGIIFDFDGVIAKSVQIKSTAFATLYETHGKDIIRKIIKHHEANGGMSRYEKIKLYHESYLNTNIINDKLIELANQFSSLVVEKVIAAPYVPGALEYIQKSSEKYKLFISTGTPTEEMNQILEGRKIAHYFTDVFGSPDKKSVHVNNIISKYNLAPDELIFYGDSNSDLHAAEHVNIPFVLIKNRFNQTLSDSFMGKIINNFIGLS